MDAEKRKKNQRGGSIRKSSLAMGISKCASQEVSRDNMIMAENRVTDMLSQSNEQGRASVQDTQLIMARSASCFFEQN